MARIEKQQEQSPSPSTSLSRDSAAGDGEKQGTLETTSAVGTPPSSSSVQQQKQQQQQQLRSSPPPTAPYTGKVQFSSGTAVTAPPSPYHHHPQQQQQQQLHHSSLPPYSNNYPPHVEYSHHHRPPPPYGAPNTYCNTYYDYRDTYHHALLAAASATSRSPITTTTLNNNYKVLSSGCTCKKSRCLKLYCQCFAASTTCGPKCKCDECHNTPRHADYIANARKGIMNRNATAFENHTMKTTTVVTTIPPPLLPMHVPPPPQPRPPLAAATPLVLHPRTLATNNNNMSWRGSPVSAMPTHYSGSDHSNRRLGIGIPDVASSPYIASPPSQNHPHHHHRRGDLPYFMHPAAPLQNQRISRQGCKCRRSSCLKKYCECFQNSMICGIHCGCVDCKNTSPSAFPLQQQVQQHHHHQQQQQQQHLLSSNSTRVVHGSNTNGYIVPSPVHQYSHPTSGSFSRHPSNGWRQNNYNNSNTSNDSSNNKNNNNNNAGSSDLCGVKNNTSEHHGNDTTADKDDQQQQAATQKYRHEKVEDEDDFFEEKKEDTVGRNYSTTTTSSSNRVASSSSDRMAIMAALAMTELSVAPTGTSEKEELIDKQHDRVEQERDVDDDSVCTTPSSTEQDEKIEGKSCIPTTDAGTVSGVLCGEATIITPRQVEEEEEEEEAEAEAEEKVDAKKRKSLDFAVGRIPFKKRKAHVDRILDHDTPPVGNVNSAASPRDSIASVESRNPSPYRSPQPVNYPFHLPPTRFPWSEARRSPPAAASPHRAQRYFPLGPPPRPMSHYHIRPPASPLSYKPSHYHPSPYYYRSPPSAMYRSSEMMIPSSPRLATSSNNSRIISKGSGSCYEELIRTTGLPKSLSFRKICSRCGKARSEHGELGFGNKCVFQDCGKCGAGYHWHELAKQPMGISCQLTVKQGAISGAVEAYERKIKDLADRAELQRAIQGKGRVYRQLSSEEQNNALAPKLLSQQIKSSLIPPLNSKNLPSPDVPNASKHPKMSTPTNSDDQPATKDKSIPSSDEKKATSVTTSTYLASLLNLKSPAASSKFLIIPTSSSLLEIKRTQSV